MSPNTSDPTITASKPNRPASAPHINGERKAPVYPAAQTTPRPLPALVGVIPGSSITIVSKVGSSADDPTPIRISDIRIAATLANVTEPRHPSPNNTCIGQVNG